MSNVLAPLHSRNMLALACGLALSCGAAAQDTLQQWQEYARQGITPDFAFAASQVSPIEPTLIGHYREMRSLGEIRLGFIQDLAPISLRVGLSESVAGGYAQPGLIEANLLSRDRSAIGTQFFSSSIGHTVGENGRISLTAVVARQRYATADFGAAPWAAREELIGLRSARPQEVSAGNGVRLGFDLPVLDTVSLNLSAQSKLDMDAFKSYRGVYSEAADFDVPARVQSQLQWDLSRSFSLALGAERVFYSEIDAFTSAALPDRFLSLLGDGSSPAFAWRDLTIYSLESVLADPTGAQWVMRLTTRQQPSPTSALLERALEREFTNTNIALGYRRALGDLGHLWLAASYAPSQYFLGALPYTERNLVDGKQVEFEALWSIPF